jgi:hypothetical protein
MTAETSARNLLCRLICAVLAFALGVAGCGIQLIFPGRVGAQTRTVSHGNFTPSSAVKRLGRKYVADRCGGAAAPA